MRAPLLLVALALSALVLARSAPPAPAPAPAPTSGASSLADPADGNARVGSMTGVTPAKPAPRTLTCDVMSRGPICLYGGQTVIAAPAQVPGLLAHYAFDNAYGLDSGPNQVHGETVMPNGPGANGRGRSAAVWNGEGFSVRSSAVFQKTAALSFWLYLQGDPDALDQWCTVVAMGDDDGGVANAAQLVLAVDVNFFSGRLRVTSTNALKKNEYIYSVAQLAFGRWHHLAVSRDAANSVSLYTDGVLDQSVLFQAVATGLPEYRIWVGRAPWDSAKCLSPFLFDEARFYARPLASFEVEAESFPSLGAVEPGFAAFGCAACSYVEADAACAKLHRTLCRRSELVSGALQVSYALGWGSRRDAYHELESRTDPDVKKIGLCCRD